MIQSLFFLFYSSG